VVVIGTAALAGWLLGATVGTAMLVRWLRWHRAVRSASSRPPRLVFAHLATALGGLMVWVAYLATGRPHALAWAAFAVLTLNNILGDTLLTRGWRQRHHASGTTGSSRRRDYLRAVVETLRGRRPVATLHALLAGVTYFLVLFAALGIGA